MKRQLNIYLIVIGAFLLFISGGFLSEGLSLTGLDNAVVSQRMAEGFEDFWLPSLDTPGNPDRQYYLPLGYWIESQWYNIFGSSTFMADKIFSVLTYIVIGLLIIRIWTLTGKSKQTGWIPLMCWITIPIVSWSATNNLLESTMTIFILLSVVCLLKASNASFVLRKRKAAGKAAGRHRIGRTAWVVTAALMMELAFLVKGFAGLFPIFFPILYWLIVRRERIVYPLFSTALILVVWVVTLLAVMLFSPQVFSHINNYLHHQLIGGILHVHTVASRFYIVYVLVLQCVIPISIVVLLGLIRIRKRPLLNYMLYWRNRGKLTALQYESAKTSLFFIALGLSGIIPIMLGLKQQEFYVVPTLPFFAIGMGCMLYFLLEDWLENIDKLANRVLSIMAGVIFSAGVLLNINSINKINSNHDLLEDMTIILPYLDDNEKIMVGREVLEQSEVAEYFYRYKKITFDTTPREHLLTLYSKAETVGEGCYVDLELPTALYHLYEFRAQACPAVVDTAVTADTTMQMTNDTITPKPMI